MPARSEIPLSKHTIYLREGDMMVLRERYSKLGASDVIRRLVSQFVDRVDRPVAAKQVNELLKELEAEG